MTLKRLGELIILAGALSALASGCGNSKKESPGPTQQQPPPSDEPQANVNDPVKSLLDDSRSSDKVTRLNAIKEMQVALIHVGQIDSTAIKSRLLEMSEKDPDDEIQANAKKALSLT